ncbi:MAG: CHAD domain-containing protein [Solirubrobacterales bacterium]
MAKARHVDDLDCDESFYLAAARVIEVRAAELSGHSRGFLGLDDVEPLHDMRVATRRLRASMEIFRPCFPKRRFRRTLSEVKALADALGERRDRDVAIRELESFAAAGPPGCGEGVGTLVEEIRAEQRSVNESLESEITPERLAALADELDRLVASARRKAGQGDLRAGPREERR